MVLTAFLLSTATIVSSACNDSPRTNPTAPHESAAKREDHDVRPERDEEDAGEEREAEEERAQRRQVMAALVAYRAPSCEAAIGKLTQLLNRGQGRWHQRNESGALPDDLLAALSEAELWRNQSKTLCAEEPQRQRFNDLQLLMDGIWQYPLTVSKTELDRRLGALSSGGIDE
jgi:hypothetical protein